MDTGGTRRKVSSPTLSGFLVLLYFLSPVEPKQQHADMLFLGNRSSIDESRGDEVTKEDETVVDADQGNSTHKS